MELFLLLFLQLQKLLELKEKKVEEEMAKVNKRNNAVPSDPTKQIQNDIKGESPVVDPSQNGSDKK